MLLVDDTTVGPPGRREVYSPVDRVTEASLPPPPEIDAGCVPDPEIEALRVPIWYSPGTNFVTTYRPGINFEPLPRCDTNARKKRCETRQLGR